MLGLNLSFSDLVCNSGHTLYFTLMMGYKSITPILSKQQQWYQFIASFLLALSLLGFEPATSQAVVKSSKDILARSATEPVQVYIWLYHMMSIL